MSDEELNKHRQVDIRKSVANEPTLAPNLIDVLREDVIRDLQDQLRLARLYLSVPDPSPKDCGFRREAGRHSDQYPATVPI